MESDFLIPDSPTERTWFKYCLYLSLGLSLILIIDNL